MPDRQLAENLDRGRKFDKLTPVRNLHHACDKSIRDKISFLFCMLMYIVFMLARKSLVNLRYKLSLTNKIGITICIEIKLFNALIIIWL